MSKACPWCFWRFGRITFLVVKTLMGTPVDWEFFTRNFYFQLRSRAHGGIQIKICLGTIKDLPILIFGKKGLFVSQNSSGHTMGWSSFSSDFLVFVRSDQIVASQWVVSVSMTKNWLNISKSLVWEVYTDILGNQEDINFLMRISLIWKFIWRLNIISHRF